MDLFGALNNAFNGISRTQDALSVVSKNVAGANQPGYVREEYIGNSGPGGMPGTDVRRVLDLYVQKQLWSESSSSGFTSVQSDYVKQLDAAFGDPTSSNTISAKFDAFSNAMTALQVSPGGAAEQSTVLATARALAQTISTASNSVQSLRSNAEDDLSQSASDANSILTSLAKLNRQISNAGGQADPALLDSRDAGLNSLAALLDVTVKTKADGTVTVTTKSGALLVDGSSAGTLAFNSKSPLTATALYSADPTKNGVGSLTLTGPSGGTVDLVTSGSIRGGKIAGLMDLRDTLLPKAQSQLDDLAAGLASSLSDRNVASSSVSNGFEVDTTGLQSGNSLHADFTDASGKTHHVSIVRVDDASKLPLAKTVTADPNDEVIGVSFSGGVTGALSSLQAGLNGLGAGLTASVGTTANTLRLTAATPASVASLSATVTNTALQGQGTPLPLFTDSPGGTPYTASLDGQDQRVGFAGRMIVNPQLLSTSNALSDYTGTTSPNDPTRINDLVSRLSQQGVTVSAQSGLGLTSGSATVASLVKQIAQSQANDTNRLTSLNDSQSTILASVQSRFSQSSGVNMDKELTDLTQLQNVYTANARVLMAVKDMFDVLMRM